MTVHSATHMKRVYAHT